MVRQPAFGLAEIAWRWSFAAACWLSACFSAAEYFKTLPVTRADLILLRTRHPILVWDSIARIFHGSGLRAVETFIVLAAALAFGWIVLSSMARAATLKSLLAYFREGTESGAKLQLRSLFGLNLLRLAVTVSAVIGVVSAFVFGSAVSPANRPAPGSGFFVFLNVIFFVWLAWSVLNWFLSLAAVFVVVQGRNTFAAITSAVDLCRRRTASVLAAGSWFGLGHIVVFVLATSVVAFPLGFAGILPAGVVLGGVLLVTLLYFAAADFLYMGRLAAYVAILELPGTPKTAEPSPPVPPNNPSDVSTINSIDRDELILSDVPSQA